MLTTTMSLNGANTTAQLVLRAGFAPDAQGCCCVCGTTHLHLLTEKGADRQTRDRTPRPDFSGLRGSGGLEPGEPVSNSPLPSRIVDEPVCTMVAVTKRWHGEAGVWRIARRRTSAQPKRMATPQPFRLHIIVKRSITAANIGKVGKICTHRRIDASTIDSYRNGACSHAATPPPQRPLLDSLGPFIPFCPLLLLRNSIPAFRDGGGALFCCRVIHSIRLKEPL